MNFRRYFDPVYADAPFVLFGLEHLLALAVVGGTGVGLFAMRGRWNAQARCAFRLSLAGWLLIWELAAHAWFSWTGIWSVRNMLPFHMCSISLWLSVIMLVTGNYRAFEFAYFLGLGGATQGLITPPTGCYEFLHFRTLQSFAVHAGIVLAAFHMTVVEGYRPTVKSLHRVVVWMGTYAVAVYLLNQVLGSNYLFISAKPNFPTLLDYLPPWPWYVGLLALIAFAITGVLYLPFWIADLRARPRL